ncbi:MAG TPA: glycosyltransferase [Streptosporangiaceae bacterium]
MRIDMVSEHASPLATLGGADAGGQNVHVAALAMALGRCGHDVRVYTRRDDPGRPDSVRLGAGVTVEHVRAGPVRPLPKDALLEHMPAFADRLARRWSDEPPDVAHAHFWMSGLAAVTAAAAAGGVPVVQTFHALGSVKRRCQPGSDTSPPERVSVERAVGRRADAVIATCTDEVRELAAYGIPASRIYVVPCGVDTAHFGPPAAGWRSPDGARRWSGGASRIVTIGRLVRRKGVDTVIAALAGVPGAELIVAGGPAAGQLAGDAEAQRLRGVAEAHAVARRVRFTGQVPHQTVPALLRSADLVVSDPWYEPFGIVPLEAMACGTPVVVSAVGGHLDTVVDGRTGLLVPPRNPAALAGALRRLLADPDRRAAMGAAGTERARSRYRWGRIAEETLTVYERVAGAPSPLAAGAVTATQKGTRS